MAIEVKTDVDTMTHEELEKALGVPGAATSWDSFGPLLIKHRVSIHPTSAWGSGDGVASRLPGWHASMKNLATVIIDTDPLIAGCKCLLTEMRRRRWDEDGNEVPQPKIIHDLR